MGKTMFVSYSHKDIDTVSNLVGAIQEKTDCKIWFDKKLHGGEEYFGIIADKILECEYFIFMVSQNSVSANWCIKELEFAMNEGRKIIAVWLEDFKPPARVRLVISNTHYIRSYDLNENEFAKSISDAFSITDDGFSYNESDEKNTDQTGNITQYFIPPKDKESIKKLLKSEEKDDFLTCFAAENAVLLGLAYELGVGVQKDKTKAGFYYRIAAHKGNLDGEYLMLALGLVNNTVNRTKTVARMNELANLGCIKALVYWGNDVYNGKWGMKQDKTTAYRWFKQAADTGDPVAKYFLGFGYRTGEVDGEPDYVIAWMYFNESAQQGFPQAYRHIAAMYKQGLMVEKNLDTARWYYMKAVECGDLVSYNFIGNLERDNQNYEEALKCYKKATEFVEENDYPNGAPLFSMAWAYEFGEGVEKSIETAIEYYFKAVARNHKTSMKRVPRVIYFDVEDENKKIELLQKAAEQNCINAEYFLGVIYEKKDDKATALSYYEAGAAKGYLKSMESLMRFYSWIFGAKEYANRQKSLDNFSLYFSLLNLPENADFLEERIKTYQLQQYYYVYAAELDIDRENNAPDRKLAMHYFKKCLECEQNYKHWSKLLVTVRNYLYGVYKTSDRASDYYHAVELTQLCDSYFAEVYEKAKQENMHNELKQALIDAYELLIERSKSGVYGIVYDSHQMFDFEQRLRELKEMQD